MTDHEAIAQLIARYARALDRRDAGLLEAVFAPDAAIDMGAIYRGAPAGFIPVAMGFMAMFTATRHDVTTLLIEDARQGSAHLEAYVRAWHLIPGQRELNVLGRYLATARHGADGWRIAAWAEVIDWGEERVIDSAWHEGNTALPKGAPDRSDPSYRAR